MLMHCTNIPGSEGWLTYESVFLCFFFSLFFLFVGGRKEQTSLSYSINYFKENTAGVDLPQVCGCVCV